MLTLTAIGLTALIMTSMVFGMALAGLIWARKAKPARRPGISFVFAGLLIMMAGGLVTQVANLLHLAPTLSIAAAGAAMLASLTGTVCMLVGLTRSRASRSG